MFAIRYSLCPWYFVLFVGLWSLTAAQAQTDGAQRFIPCGVNDIAICELHTGLMWTKKTTGGAGVCTQNVHGVQATCTQVQAAGAWIQTVNGENNGVGHAGFTDWRLPSVEELVSLVDYTRCAQSVGGACGDPAASDPAIGPTAANVYWTATEAATNQAANAWSVQFNAGGVAVDGKNLDKYVRAVRAGGQVPCATGQAVCDLDTGLMWEKKVEGGGECAANLHVVDATCTFAQAIGAWIQAINAESDGAGYLGFNDWRVPSVQELGSIVDYLLDLPIGVPAIKPVFGPTKNSPYWSSTPAKKDPQEVWEVSFFQGSVFATDRANANHVRAVRGGR